MNHLIIIGVGGFAREVYWHAQCSIGYGAEWDLKGFLDGDVHLAQEEYDKLQLPVFGSVLDYSPQTDDVFICAVGEPKIKEKLVNIVLEKGGKFMKLIHNTAIIHGTAKLGRGNILAPYVNIHDHAIVGDFVTLNGYSGIGHDGLVGDFSSFMGSAVLNGYVKAGKRVYMAHGAIALPHSVIEDDAYIGTGSVVFKRVKAGKKVFDNPAMPI